jgi:hypothetical protein
MTYRKDRTMSALTKRYVGLDVHKHYVMIAAVNAAHEQGCSVLQYTDIVEDIIQVHTVIEKLKADIFDLVFA